MRRRAAMYMAALVAAAAWCGGAETALVKAGAVHTVSGEVIVPGMILIVDGRIAEVGKEVAAPDGAAVYTAEAAVPEQVGRAGLAVEAPRQVGVIGRQHHRQHHQRVPGALAVAGRERPHGQGGAALAALATTQTGAIDQLLSFRTGKVGSVLGPIRPGVDDWVPEINQQQCPFATMRLPQTIPGRPRPTAV